MRSLKFFVFTQTFLRSFNLFCNHSNFFAFTLNFLCRQSVLDRRERWRVQMQYKSSKSNDGIRSLFSRLATRVQRLAIACMCAEKCRFCGREIALGYDGDRNIEGDGNIDHDGNNSDVKSDSDRNSKLTSLLSFLNVPAQSIKNELMSLSIAATHAALVPPALVRLACQTNPSPRLSECLCSICWEEIEIDLPTLGFVQLCGKSQIELPVASGANYEGKVKELIRTFKYDGDTILAADLASIMSLGWSTLTDYMPASNILLVPVPLHKSRKRTRGYNQSELLARELSKLIALPVSVNALIRKNATRPQQTLGKSERLQNVSNSFVGNKKKLAGRTIVLVDDVCTSGATLVACANEALACGALSVVALTVARALLAYDS
jgi:ComF family protein